MATPLDQIFYLAKSTVGNHWGNSGKGAPLAPQGP